MQRSYENAICLIRASPTKPRPAKGVLPRKAEPHWNGLGGMRGNLQLLGYTDEKLRDLRVIHVAGTKGKGGTCAFVDSFLRAHGERTGFPLKVGLYTSPPISSLLDTIRINFTPVSEDMFTSCFFDVWEKVSDHTSQKGWPMPGYLQLLTLVSIHIFMKAKVDVAIYETHSGGEYDATNILFPAVTGITTLGMDHVETLGPTIRDIAWHKGGIMKPGIPSFSSPQTPEAAIVLQQRAVEKGVRLEFVESDPALPAAAPALEPFVQKLNASLALSLVRSFLKGAADGELASVDIVRGIEQYNWPGRFQKVFDGRYRWFLDVAHNELSLEIAAKWFADAVNSMPSNPPFKLVLIFSHVSDRDGPALLKCLKETLGRSAVCMQHVIFCTLKTGLEENAADDSPNTRIVSPDIQRLYAETWKILDPDAQISVSPSIRDALELAKQIGNESNGMQTLVTGTTPLVRSVLAFMKEGVLACPSLTT